MLKRSLRPLKQLSYGAISAVVMVPNRTQPMLGKAFASAIGAMACFAAAVAALGQERKPEGVQPSSGTPRLVIQPAADAAWEARIREVEKVLYSAAGELWRYFPERKLDPILVEPQGGPITLYRRGPNGEYLVRLHTGKRLLGATRLSVRARVWTYPCQPRRVRPPKQVVRGIDLRNGVPIRPPADGGDMEDAAALSQLDGLLPALLEYAADRIRTAHLPPGKTLAKWYRENEAVLYRNAYSRERNTVVAVALLPLFEERPQHWEAITWLNDGKLRKAARLPTSSRRGWRWRRRSINGS